MSFGIFKKQWEEFYQVGYSTPEEEDAKELKKVCTMKKTCKYVGVWLY